MRTTVTLDPDVHKLLTSTAHRTGRPFKHVLNDAVRSGLKARSLAARTPFEQPTFSMGKPRVDLTKAHSLATDLEDEGRAEKIRAAR